MYGITKDRLAHEVLARWRLASGEVIAPGQREDEIDWVQVDREILQLVAQNARQLSMVTPRLFLNLSAQTATDTNSWTAWLALLQRLVSLARFSIIVELSEDMCDETVRFIWQPLRRLQVKLAIDDFGRGYSTRFRLTQFDWDYCKFEADSLYDEQTISGLQYCHHSGIMPIIERVEHQISQQQFMLMGLHWQQGFYHGRPELLSEYLLRHDDTNPDNENKTTYLTQLE